MRDEHSRRVYRRWLDAEEEVDELLVENDSLHTAVGAFLHGPDCGTDECREKGYCLQCVIALENAYDDIKEQP